MLKEGEITPASINHYLREVRAFLYWAMEKDYVPSKFKIKLISEHDTIPTTYTDEEMHRLLTKPAKNASFVEWRNWASISWMFATGNRAATVCNVKLCDLDFTRKEIVIRYTKTRTPQILPMSTALSYVLKDYMRKWRHGAGDKAYLFPNISDEKLTVGALEQSVRDYNHRHGVKTTSVHAFRHTFAKNWIINTGDVFRLQKMLGHKTLEMTRRYVNLFGEDLKIGFDSYNPLDRQKGTRNRRQEIKRAV
jgi:integrase/recombinase XerD